MKATLIPNGLKFEGVLDKMTSGQHLEQAFENLVSKGISGPVILDLSSVSRGNSAGIVTWLRFFKKIAHPAKYVNAPIWLVSQFSMIKGYFDHNSYVESFQAPYFDLKTEKSSSSILRIGKDLPLLESYENFQAPNLVINGNDCEPDFTPQQYFSFISENYPVFKKNLT
jgi:hypothetical protein